MGYDSHLRVCTRAVLAVTVGLLGLGGTFGCQGEKVEVDQPISGYRERMQPERQPEAEAAGGGDVRSDREGADDGRVLAQLAGSQSEETKRAALMTGPEVAEPPAPAELLAQVPDPCEAEGAFAGRLARIEETAREERVVNQYKRVVQKAVEYLADLRQPRQVELSLAECVHRALANNYAIRLESYTPGISRTRLIEAEAAFDASFFLDFSYSDLDRASASSLASSQSDYRSYKGGIRQLLPTGMRVETGLGQSRTFNALTQITSQFTVLNPAYDTTFTASFTQPLLRGFGLDYNRAALNIARADLRISHETFIERVRDTLLQVEQAYWQLVATRRDAMITAETVAQNWVTYQSMKERQTYDATPVELNNSKSRWQSQQVRYIETIKLVRDAEDRLKNLMNDPDFKLSDDLEIIPTETPLAAPIALDHFAEVRTALENRSEIRKARLQIEQARIQTQRAKNETLPQLDLAFQYEVQGIGINADGSFDQATTNRFRSYTVSASFAYPFGNRAARAALRRSRMQESQAVVQSQQWLDAVAEEVNLAVRQLTFRYKQIPPQLDAVLAADGNLRALQARTEAISPAYLETELSAVEQVANTRRVLLQVLTEYNAAVVQLEKAKGTLLEYNNVVVSDEPAGR